jgi:hypothetical protein
VLWWCEIGAVAVIVIGFGMDAVTAMGDAIVRLGVGLLVATPFAATLIVAILSRRTHGRMASFALGTLLVAAVGMLAALWTAGR